MINRVTAGNSPEFLHAASYPTFGSINCTAVDYCGIKINRFLRSNRNISCMIISVISSQFSVLGLLIMPEKLTQK